MEEENSLKRLPVILPYQKSAERRKRGRGQHRRPREVGDDGVRAGDAVTGEKPQEKPHGSRPSTEGGQEWGRANQGNGPPIVSTNLSPAFFYLKNCMTFSPFKLLEAKNVCPF